VIAVGIGGATLAVDGTLAIQLVESGVSSSELGFAGRAALGAVISSPAWILDAAEAVSARVSKSTTPRQVGGEAQDYI